MNRITSIETSHRTSLAAIVGNISNDVASDDFHFELNNLTMGTQIKMFVDNTSVQPLSTETFQ